ncbi:putative P7 protein [Cherry luteovirus A]|nr:putative P7 protein [Cherry luteovirus A]
MVWDGFDVNRARRNFCLWSAVSQFTNIPNEEHAETPCFCSRVWLSLPVKRPERLLCISRPSVRECNSGVDP